MAAVENLGRTCRTNRLAHLHRGSVAARQREIAAVAAAHAKRGSRTARADRHRRGLLRGRIGEETRQPRGLMLLFLQATEQEIEQSFSGCLAWRDRHCACKSKCGNKPRAAPPAPFIPLCTQRELHPNATNPGLETLGFSPDSP